MNRTQKKCVVASTGFHVLLLLILFIGPAFLSSKEKGEDRALIDFVPLKTIDEALSGGGSPTARPPQAAPTPPAPLPPPQPPAPQQQVVAPQPEPPKITRPEPETFDVKPTKKLPDVSLKAVPRPKDKANAKQKATTSSDSQSDAAAERQRKLANAARNAARALRDGLSSSTTVEMRGAGGGGVPYANFLDAVKKAYSDAWIVPDGVTDDEATATASVTIARDGTVLKSKIIRPSGNALADASVEATLRRVTFAAPLPDSAKENQRTVNIKFNVKTKRGLG